MLLAAAWLDDSCRLRASRTVSDRVRQLALEAIEKAAPVYTRLTGTMLTHPNRSFLHGIATCTDLALNPSFVYQLGEDNGAGVQMGGIAGVINVRTDVEFEPLTRFIALARGLHHPAAASRLASLSGDRGEWARAIADLAAEQLRDHPLNGVEHRPTLPPFTYDHSRLAILAARQVLAYGARSEVPASVALLFADMFGVLAGALRFRQSTPLLLSSGTHHEIASLISELGGLHLAAAREAEVYVRPPRGFNFLPGPVLEEAFDLLTEHLPGWRDSKTVDPLDKSLVTRASTALRTAGTERRPAGMAGLVAEWIARDALPHLQTCRTLVRGDARDVAARVYSPAFGFAGPTLRDVLRWHQIEPRLIGL
jgi:hypothetical protein